MVHARVPKSVYELLKRTAAILGVSISELCRQAIMNYLRELRETSFFSAMQTLQQQKNGDCYA